MSAAITGQRLARARGSGTKMEPCHHHHHLLHLLATALAPWQHHLGRNSRAEGFNWPILQTVDLNLHEERLWGFLMISLGSCAAPPVRTSAVLTCSWMAFLCLQSVLWGCAPRRVGYLRRSLSLSTGIWVRCTCDCKFPIAESGLCSDCLDL